METPSPFSPRPLIQKIGTALRTQRVAREFGIETLVRLLNEYLPEEQVAEVRRAYVFGAEMHAGQNRSSGEPYIFHPLAVARILAEMRLDHVTLIAAILHDVIEDTTVSKDEIARQFGAEVAKLVDGVSKIEKIEGMSRNERQAESFRKLLLAMTDDLRVILVKLADRLHNMRTLGAMAPEKKRRIAQETIEIYSPIAQRLGINTLRRELEDLAFANLYPQRYEVFVKAVGDRLGDVKSLIRDIEQRIARALAEEGIGATVVGRQKSYYSIYRKMQRKRLKFLDVMDLLGFRVVVAKLDECYRALGIVHHVFKPVPGLFDDYIANSRGNGYQSLHTTCVGPEGKKIEVQIRTREMHHIAESGIAAHWQYKQGSRDASNSSSAPQARAREWLQMLLESEGSDGAQELVENVKVDLFPDEVYVFTPKGQIRRLPKGATPVDFAYTVHSELGDRCVAARVDGHLEPLNTPLKNGQTVEIITSRHARPNAAWLNYVKTAKARSRIRAFLKEQREDEAIRLGRRLLEIALRELKLPPSVLTAKAAAPVLASYKLDELEDLFISIGTGERLAPLVARHFLPESASGTRSDGSTPLAVEGTEGLVIDYGRCCRPIPGDPIIGYVSASRGIIIHRLDCEHVQTRKGGPGERIALVWADKVQGDFLAELRLKAHNRRGLLASVASEISEAGSSIENVQMPDRTVSEEAVEMRFLLTVKDRTQLARVIKRVRRLSAVERVSRG
ncbi:MAG: bifunctional (p)ppGpp synthetase/guanosine-3',5'-bis(diphosphate) 3'-pyrophosphohydrolase [Stagnimonas sp.]|nr:bifunctional (p)ppGpp synthetase/guanosine-3',5'-bis(diphosphate) 3'-pyrophosphohydrolase [Stagnimonas sp.]